MDMERFHQMPAFMKEEMDNLKHVAAPFLKKRLIFLLSRFRCLLLHWFIFLLFGGRQASYGTDSMIKIGCAAAAAAFGMALFRESSYQKEMFSNR